MSNLPSPVRVTALGGSLKRGSSSLTAPRAAAAGAEDAGAEVDLLEIAALDLAPYAPGEEPPEAARRLAESAAQADAMLCRTPPRATSGAFRRARGRRTCAGSRPTPIGPQRVLIGIELGGLMYTDDGGATFTDHRTGDQPDVHPLAWHQTALGAALARAARSACGRRRLSPCPPPKMPQIKDLASTSFERCSSTARSSVRRSAATPTG